MIMHIILINYIGIFLPKKGMRNNMYYQNYEDYMRSILGYSQKQDYMDTYERNNNYIPTNYTIQTPRYSTEIMDLYPDIYKIINPMVCKICEANTKTITRELIEKMTDEIYLNIESKPNLEENDVVNIRVNLPKENTPANSSTSKMKTATTKSTTTSNVATSKRIHDNRNEKVQNKEERNNTTRSNNNRETRQFRKNNTLRDLIRILILNRLLGTDIRPPRPRPPMPPRPPYPSRPNPNPRPPIQPRDLYSNQLNANI